MKIASLCKVCLSKNEPVVFTSLVYFSSGYDSGRSLTQSQQYHTLKNIMKSKQNYELGFQKDPGPDR